MNDQFRKNWGLLLLLIALTAASGFGNYQYWQSQQHVSELAHQGANTHKALCALKHDLARREGDNEKFLRMTPAERVQKYGPALGAIPVKIIKQSIHGQRATLASLSDLQGCAPPQ